MDAADAVVLAASATKLGPEAAGRVVVSGSHGGAYVAYLVAKAAARAAILNDAGVGRDDAGIAGLGRCAAIGMAAATVGHDSARIGDARGQHPPRCDQPRQRSCPVAGLRAGDAVPPGGGAAVPGTATQ